MVNVGPLMVNLGPPMVNVGSPMVKVGPPMVNLGTLLVNLGPPAQPTQKLLIEKILKAVEEWVLSSGMHPLLTNPLLSPHYPLSSAKKESYTHTNAHTSTHMHARMRIHAHNYAKCIIQVAEEQSLTYWPCYILRTVFTYENSLIYARN